MASRFCNSICLHDQIVPHRAVVILEKNIKWFILLSLFPLLLVVRRRGSTGGFLAQWATVEGLLSIQMLVLSAWLKLASVLVQRLILIFSLAASLGCFPHVDLILKFPLIWFLRLLWPLYGRFPLVYCSRSLLLFLPIRCEGVIIIFRPALPFPWLLSSLASASCTSVNLVGCGVDLLIDLIPVHAHNIMLAGNSRSRSWPGAHWVLWEARLLGSLRSLGWPLAWSLVWIFRP